ncbi:uncharacterized protein IWZ02DRAFT_495105 [Phyllosticta citriasiana]|uniref:uncharacterized protein n=1 Tax=Phyllosticta citriasiana TaxID=595635 RepID=UPI0030FDB315
MGKDGSYDWGDTSLPHLNIKDADIFEPVDVFCGKDTIFFTFDMLLLKIKLLLDLKTLQRSPNNIDEIATTIVQSRKEELRAIERTPGAEFTEPLNLIERHATIFGKVNIMLLKVKFLQDLRMLRDSSGHHPCLKGTLVSKRFKDLPAVELEKLINIIDLQAK